MEDLRFKKQLEDLDGEFLALTGTFLEALWRSKVTSTGGAVQPSAWVKSFFEVLPIVKNPQCRKAAFLKSEALSFAEGLLKLGFTVCETPDEEYAQGLAAVQDFCIHHTQKMVLCAEQLDTILLTRAVSPSRIAWLALRPIPENMKSLLKSSSCQWFFPQEEIASAEVLNIQKPAADAKSEDRIKSFCETQPTFESEMKLIPESLFSGPIQTFSCADVVENLQQRLQETQKRAKAVRRGIFGQSCSTLRLIDRLAHPKDCVMMENLFRTAFLSFQWIHTFQDRLTPDHENLLRDYATLGASSLCILRSLYRDRLGSEYPDDLFRGAADVLQRVREKISDEIPHLRLESIISETMIPKNVRILKHLAQRKSAVRIRDKIRTILIQINEKNATNIFDSEESEKENWSKIVQLSTELGTDYGEPANSDFWQEIFQPILDEMPEFETSSKEGETTDEFTFQATPFFIKIIQNLEAQESQNESDFEEAMARDGLSETFPFFENAQRESAGTASDVLGHQSVQRVREVFGGTKMVFVGGTPNAQTKARIESFFGIKLIWEECGHHFGLDRYQAWLQDPSISCFLVKKTWCSHFQYQKLLHEFQVCGKKCVRLRNETHPVAIAIKIAKQCLPKESADK